MTLFSLGFTISVKPVKRSLFGLVQQAARQPNAAATIVYFKLVGCSCIAKGSFAGCHASCSSPALRSGSFCVLQPASFNRILIRSITPRSYPNILLPGLASRNRTQS